MDDNPESMHRDHADAPLWWMVLLYPLGLVLAAYAWVRDR